MSYVIAITGFYYRMSSRSYDFRTSHFQCFVDPTSVLYVLPLIFTNGPPFPRGCRSEGSFQQQCPPKFVDASSEHLMDVGHRQGLRVSDTIFPFIRSLLTTFGVGIIFFFLFAPMTMRSDGAIMWSSVPICSNLKSL